MKTGMTLLAMSCALALAACGSDDRPADAGSPADATTMPVDTTAPDTTAQDAAPADAAGGGDADLSATPNSEHTAAGAEDEPAADGDAAATEAGGDAPATAASGSCDVTIEGNDRIQFNLDTINIPASCSDFTITLNHVGQLPVAAMGHNVVVVATSDFAGVAADGLAAGADANYVPAGDDRVIANTDMVGGGQSTSVTFSTSSLEQGGDYTFFCSFPGHSALMRGSVNFGG